MGEDSVSRAFQDDAVYQGVQAYVADYIRGVLAQHADVSSVIINSLETPANTGLNLAHLAIVPCIRPVGRNNPGATGTPSSLLDENHPLIIQVGGGIVEGMPDPVRLVQTIRGLSALATASPHDEVVLGELSDCISVEKELSGEETQLPNGKPTIINCGRKVLLFPGHILDRENFARSKYRLAGTENVPESTPPSVVFRHALKPHANTERFEKVWR